MSTIFETRPEHDGHDSVSAMAETAKHEGERLRQLLEARGVTQTALGKRAGIGRAAVNRWMNAKTFNRAVWEKLEQALPLLGLDPREIRPQEQEGKFEDFTAELQAWDDAHLDLLKRILLSSRASRKNVWTFLLGALRNVKK